MRDWKNPNDYFTDEMIYVCDYDIRQEIGCTEKFINLGFLKDLRWDYFAEYKTLCKDCKYYRHDVGVYFGNGNYTINFPTEDVIYCRTIIRNEDELSLFVSLVPKTIKAIFFDDIRIDNLSALKELSSLECVIISYCPKLLSFWNFEKTPNLKVLKYTANSHLKDLSELSKAENLEYFEIESLVSNVNMNYVDSFYPLTKLEKLKEVSFSSVMCSDNNIDNLINIPNLCKMWISPNTFSTEDFAKFEALKFKIYEEYGIYKNGDDFVCPLGKGKRCFRSEKAKEKFTNEYLELMGKYQ